MPPHQIVNLGIVQIPQGRRLFGPMTVLENLKLGAYSRRSAKEIAKDIELILSAFRD